MSGIYQDLNPGDKKMAYKDEAPESWRYDPWQCPFDTWNGVEWNLGGPNKHPFMKANSDQHFGDLLTMLRVCSLMDAW